MLYIIEFLEKYINFSRPFEIGLSASNLSLHEENTHLLWEFNSLLLLY